MKDLSHYRKSYEKSQLVESSLPENPMALFDTWFHETESAGAGEEINAVTVSTIDPDGFPKSRIVLLKMYTEEGFVFYTNYDSAKGRAIAANPKVCMSFFWPWTERQVIIRGHAEKVDESVSDAYFHTRPAGSKLGAAASNQSEEIPSREFLEEKLRALEEKFPDGNVPRPASWGGYLVRPDQIEFWQGRENRLHDRIRYTLKNSIWQRCRLSP